MRYLGGDGRSALAGTTMLLRRCEVLKSVTRLRLEMIQFVDCQGWLVISITCFSLFTLVGLVVLTPYVVVHAAIMSLVDRKRRISDYLHLQNSEILIQIPNFTMMENQTEFKFKITKRVSIACRLDQRLWMTVERLRTSNEPEATNVTNFREEARRSWTPERCHK